MFFWDQQHPISKVGYIFEEYVFQTLKAFFSQKGVFFTKAMKGNVTAFTKNENIETNNVRDKHPFAVNNGDKAWSLECVFTWQ